MSNLFGNAKFGGEFVKRKWFKLKDGESTFRILPPMGDLARDGRWSVFYNIHYGYKNSKGEMRTFQSPLVKNRKTKMVEVADAALDRINQLKAKLEEAKKEGNKEVADQLTKLVGSSKARYNLDSNHYMNVIDEQGNIGILKIRHRAMLSLQAEIKKLRDQGIEPLSPEAGRFFTFHRSGNAFDTVYQVSVKKEKVRIEGHGVLERDIVHTVTDDIAARCLAFKDGSFIYKEATKLDTLFKKPSAEEVERIVKEGERAVDEILDKKNDSQPQSASTYQEPEADVEEDSNDSAPVAQSVPAVQVTMESSPAPSVTTVAKTMAAPVQEVKAQVLTSSKTSAQSVSQMSDEEFLKSMGL